MTDIFAEPVRQKQALRERLRFRRRHFTANLDAMARLAAFRALPRSLAEMIEGCGPVGAYIAWGDEPDILPALSGYPIALPFHRDRSETMDFRHWMPGGALVKGPWGPRQPAEAGPSAEPRLVLCPLVGFDRNGGRLGQGGGHYDRYFAAHPHVVRIGVGWSVQEVDVIPAESTDARLDAVLTEQEFIVCGDRV